MPVDVRWGRDLSSQFEDMRTSSLEMAYIETETRLQKKREEAERPDDIFVSVELTYHVNLANNTNPIHCLFSNKQDLTNLIRHEPKCYRNFHKVCLRGLAKYSNAI